MLWSRLRALAVRLRTTGFSCVIIFKTLAVTELKLYLFRSFAEVLDMRLAASITALPRTTCHELEK